MLISIESLARDFNKTQDLYLKTRKFKRLNSIAWGLFLFGSIVFVISVIMDIIGLHQLQIKLLIAMIVIYLPLFILNKIVNHQHAKFKRGNDSIERGVNYFKNFLSGKKIDKEKEAILISLIDDEEKQLEAGKNKLLFNALIITLFFISTQAYAWLKEILPMKGSGEKDWIFFILSFIIFGFYIVSYLEIKDFFFWKRDMKISSFQRMKKCLKLAILNKEE